MFILANPTNNVCADEAMKIGVEDQWATERSMRPKGVRCLIFLGDVLHIRMGEYVIGLRLKRGRFCWGLLGIRLV